MRRLNQALAFIILNNIALKLIKSYGIVKRHGQ